jgi:hypothetical protein
MKKEVKYKQITKKEVEILLEDKILEALRKKQD